MLFGNFAVVHQKICVFIISFLFLIKYHFTQQNIKQSETGIGDEKLLVELYV